MRKLTAATPGLLPTLLLSALLSLSLAACGDDEGDGDATDPATEPSPTSASASASESTSPTPSGPTSQPSAPQSSDGSSGPTGATVSCDYPSDGTDSGATPPPAEEPADGTVTAQVSTSIGGLTFELDAGGAPCTVGSFVSLADQGYFDGTTCHRLTTQVIFVLQCGDPTATGRGGPGYTLPDEFPDAAAYGPGTLAMANTGIPGSGGSQFFIVYDGTETQLPPAYTIFGTVTSGIDLVADAAAEGTVNGTPDGAPAVPVNIRSVTTG